MIDDELQSKISKLADDYERTEGECFTKQMAIKDCKKKSPRKYLCCCSLELIFLTLCFNFYLLVSTPTC